MATEQKPSVGRIVHFSHPRKPTPYPAVITHVNEDGTANLLVFDDAIYKLGQSGFIPEVPAGAPGTAGTWHWPPYVPATPAPVGGYQTTAPVAGNVDQVGEPSMKAESHDTFDPETETVVDVSKEPI
jgi:hypothetical protein